MAFIAYSLCAITAAGCAVLLLVAYRRAGARLLLWAGICFTLLACNNVLIAVDLVIFPEVNLFVLRSAAAFVGLALMLYGLVWDAK